jgi:hypothetical protein
MADNQYAKPKMTKEQAGYVDKSSSPAEHRCGICEFHLHVPGTKLIECGIVAGSIEKMGGCDYFEMDLIANANSKITLASNPPTKK